MHHMRRKIGRAIIGASVWTFGICMPATASEERLEFRQGENLIFGWQKELLTNPKGGGKFASSAFIHPLRTPAGFECTTIQPSDHLHHLGLWWPWKFIELDGKKFNTWEIQEGQGAHVARTVKTLSSKPGKAEWEFLNETVVKPKDAAPVVAIHETAHITLTTGADSTVLDISLQQKPAGSPVTIAAYRYSGFSWRGPASWNKDNSTMTTSGGKGRDNANGTPARWVVVSGPGAKGTASLLILSAAEKQAGTAEKMHDGAPFVNFNPVMDKPLPLDDAHPAVAMRKYRVIAADRELDAAAAETEWRKWTAE
jgi:Methane oxygenase PmoA